MAHTTSLKKKQDKMAYLPSGHHLIDHHPSGIHAQLGDHDERITQLGQGRLDPLLALGDISPHESLSHVIHHEQSLAGIRTMWLDKGILARLNPFLVENKGHLVWATSGHPLERRINSEQQVCSPSEA
jgi:hypothetical protein